MCFNSCGFSNSVVETKFSKISCVIYKTSVSPNFFKIIRLTKMYNLKYVYNLTCARIKCCNQINTDGRTFITMINISVEGRSDKNRLLHTSLRKKLLRDST